ncbi:MAG: ATP-binding cassette domain-containing protein [Pseudomonadota bacterium]
MLKLEHVEIRKGDFHLKSHFDLKQGHIYAVLGPSGGGKSTLLEAIAGFDAVSAGQIAWHDRSITTLPPGDRPIAMLFQDGNLFPHLTAAQNVGLGLHPNLRLTKQDQSEIVKALSEVGLDGLADRKPAALSGGQQARVALARLTVQRRELILLDEPFAALGPALKAEMLTLVADLACARHATVLMVTHEPEDARHIADQVILVAEGQAHPPVKTQQIFDNPPPQLRDYLGQK